MIPLIDALKDAGANALGILGARGGKHLQRLRRLIYWSGLGGWPICAYQGSQAQYHYDLDEIMRRVGQ